MKLFRLFLTSLFLTCILALFIPASGVFAKSTHVTQPVHYLTSPSCYGDGLPHNNPPIQGCDGQNASNCLQYLENSKAIGSSDGEGTIGQLQLYYSPTNNNGCNAWHVEVYISHAGCYYVLSANTIETGADSSSANGGNERQICQGQSFNSVMVGDWQPGGCYYGYSYVYDASSNQQHTVSATFCYQGTH